MFRWTRHCNRSSRSQKLVHVTHAVSAHADNGRPNRAKNKSDTNP